MKAKGIASFDQLMDTRYGDCAPPPRRFAATIEELLGNHYGAPAAAPKPPRVAIAKSLSIDDGEVLPGQRRGRARAKAMSRPFSTPAEVTPAAQPTAPAEPAAGLPDEERARQERLLDLCAAPPDHAPSGPAIPPGPSPEGPDPAPPASPKAGTEDEFLADMKSIMSGQKIYDPVRKSLADRHEVAAPPEARADPIAPPAGQPAPHAAPVPAGADIFQAIAQSMEYAGAYDLGSVELENRFAQFDESAVANRPKIADPSAQPPAMPEPPAPPVLDEFRNDLQDMLARPQLPEPPAPPEISPLPEPPAAEQFFPDLGGATPAAAPLWATQSSRLPAYAEPFYDTGEHVLAGGDHYPDQLMVGRPPGVAFSYGELIAMADLFKRVDDMTAASTAELTKLKAKIVASAAHYRAREGQRPPNPADKDWNEITGGRYMRLAEDNYHHFAPNLLFKDAAFAKSPVINGDHRATWESYHRRAIAEAQAMGLDPANSNRSYIPQGPLITNAFGDHFLTDAFAAGHVFNKEAIANGFKANFYTGGKVNADAKAFLSRLAAKVFTGEFAEKFSQLETYEPHKAWWNVVDWNPNINSASRFADLLVEIANQEPDTVANLAVKGLHDRLNEEGLMVVNAAGAKEWKLFGDGHLYLSPTTLEIMRAAVSQSVANILDPQIMASNANIDALVEKVWAHVPQLTPASAKKVRELAPLYITPSSNVLLESTAKLLTKEVGLLIEELTDPKRKALKKA